MPRIVLYVARRALLYGIAYGVTLTAVVVAVTELTGQGREGDRLQAAAVVGAGLCAVLVLGQFGVGLAHVRAVRAAGRPVELAAVRVGQHGESELAAAPAEVREAAARALKTLYGRPSRSDDGQLSAVRPGSRQRLAQRIWVQVEAAGGPERSVVRVSSAPRLGLSAWDMGQGAREVAEVLEAVRRRRRRAEAHGRGSPNETRPDRGRYFKPSDCTRTRPTTALIRGDGYVASASECESRARASSQQAMGSPQVGDRAHDRCERNPRNYLAFLGLAAALCR